MAGAIGAGSTSPPSPSLQRAVVPKGAAGVPLLSAGRPRQAGKTCISILAPAPFQQVTKKAGIDDPSVTWSRRPAPGRRWATVTPPRSPLSFTVTTTGGPHAQNLVGARGFEPPTFLTPFRRATKLRHPP